MAVVKQVDGDKLWLKKYDFVMQIAAIRSAKNMVKDELEQDIYTEIKRLRKVASAIKSGTTTRVPGNNTLFVLPNGHKVLFYSDGIQLNDTVYYESAKDCGALAYKKWINMSFEERNAGSFNVLKSGEVSKKQMPLKKTIINKTMEPVSPSKLNQKPKG